MLHVGDCTAAMLMRTGMDRAGGEVIAPAGIACRAVDSRNVPAVGAALAAPTGGSATTVTPALKVMVCLVLILFKMILVPMAMRSASPLEREGPMMALGNCTEPNKTPFISLVSS